MQTQINQVQDEFTKSLKQTKDLNSLENLRVEMLGKKGKVTALLANLRNVEKSQKRQMGQSINMLKKLVEKQIAEKKHELEKQQLEKLINSAKKIDITLPTNQKFGSLHPITITAKEVEDVFVSMGFVVEDGSEIVTEYENFEAVNIPEDHPARDMQDTFWLENNQVLKTHTSASQNRILKKYAKNLQAGGDIRAIFPGRCFRNENLDATHENTFFQIEGIMVGEDISVANLIYFMKNMLEGVFKKHIDVRLRPGYFPFVEPGFELDASCVFCEGKGCSVCKQTGWIELCPCGMIHPEVLKMGGIDNKKYKGFAFGLGLTRLVMLKYGLKEIRLLNSGNLKFLKQFGTK
jgi:phenylalanyl-tRNA synthetase alpha chain